MRIDRRLCINTALIWIVQAAVTPSARAQLGAGGVFVCANCSTSPQLGVLQASHDIAYAKQLLQYGIQVQQLADAIKQSTHGGPMELTNIAGDLNQLATVVQGTQALAYSLGQQDQVFRQVFPGYQTSQYAPPPALGSYQSQYAQWAQTALSTTQGLLRGVGVQGSMLQTEQSILTILSTLGSSNLLDRNNAINLTNSLAAEQVAQMQKLRQLQLEDMTSRAAYQGYQIQRDANTESASQWFFNSGQIGSDHQVFGTGMH
jgi:P-type conjugative transfer protein TrbJ